MIGRLFLALMFATAPLSAAEPIRVLVFTTTDCPISNRYAPEIQRLAAKFSERGEVSSSCIRCRPIRRS